MNPNIELLDKALKIIEEHPEHWNQSHWHCGTSHCLAGHIYLIIHELPYDCGSINNDEDCPLDDYDDDVLENTYWDAKKALNISTKDADMLFDGENTLDDLKRMRDDLAFYGCITTFL